MSIGQLMQVSYFMLALSALFAGVAAALFFIYDIRHCFKSIRHGYAPKKGGTKSNEDVPYEKPVTERLKTERLGSEKFETEKLVTKIIMNDDEYTEGKAETEALELIQNIVCMHDTGEKNSGR